MDKYCQNQKICTSGLTEYYFFTWSIPEISMIDELNMTSVQFKMLNGRIYYASLQSSKDKMAFKIASTSACLKCFVSLVIGTKTELLSKGSEASPKCINSWNQYDLVTLSPADECFKELKRHPNKSLTLNCKIIYRVKVSTASVKAPGNTLSDSLGKLKIWTAPLRNYSESAIKEKVLLQVGEETEAVSKAILCAHSSVFAKMFENDMREMKENVITVADIEMPVLKVFISFLYTGKLLKREFDLLCDLYYAADKYEVAELRQICVDLIIQRISMDTVYRVIKLAFTHNDQLLKSTVLAFIATDIETWCSTNKQLEKFDK